MTLTKQDCEDLAAQIDSEGFDYYFTDYGADPKLAAICGREIDIYVEARKALCEVLMKNGIEIEL